MGQKTVSFVGPSMRNSAPESIYKMDNLNTFKHNFENDCLNWTNYELMKWVPHSCYFKDVLDIFFVLWIYLSIFFHLFLMFLSLTDHNENKKFLPVLCYSSISFAVHFSVARSNFYFLTIFNRLFYYCFVFINYITFSSNNFVIFFCLWWNKTYLITYWSLWKKKVGFFCTIYFVRRKWFWCLCFIHFQNIHTFIFQKA